MANRHYDTHMDWYTPVPVSADLRSHVVCAWTAQIQRWHSITPDGCVDVVWTSAGDVRVCGPETSGWSIRLPEGTRAVGVRLRPGVAHSLFSVNMGELRDRRVEFADLVGPACAADIRAELKTHPSAGNAPFAWWSRLPGSWTIRASSTTGWRARSRPAWRAGRGTSRNWPV